MRPVDADELVMFPYSERSGTEDQIAEWIEQAGLSEDDTADRARELCWKVIAGCVNVVKTQSTLTPQNEPLTLEELRRMAGVNALWLEKLSGPNKLRLMLIHSVSDGWWTCCDFNGFVTFNADDYGGKYLLYRCPPERQEDT